MLIDGDRILWAIRKLTNREKHRLLLAVAATRQIRFGGAARTPEGSVIPGLRVEAWSDSEPISRVEAGETFDFPKPSDRAEGRLQVFVAFDEPKIFGTALVVTGHFNQQAIRKVWSVLEQFRFDQDSLVL